MKKFYSLLALLMMTFVSTSAQETPEIWLVDGSEYFFQNVATDGWIGAGNAWGTQASIIKYPKNYKAVKVSDGVYKFDSHLMRDATNHFLGDGYTDNKGDQWSVYAAGDGTYYLKPIDGNQKDKYISSDEEGLGKPVVYLDAPTENSKWRIYSYDGVLAKMKTATAETPVKITELIEANTFAVHSITSSYSPWKRTGFDGTGSPANSAVGSSSHLCAESYHSSNGFKFAQTINQCVLPGVYRLDAQAFYRQDGDDNENLPYFGVKDYKTYFPIKTGNEGSMDAAYASFLEKKYTVEPLLFAIGEEDNEYVIEIANKNKTMWNIWGELELSYLGSGEDAYQALLDTFLARKPDYSAVTYITKSVNRAYNNVLEEYSSAGSLEEVQDAMAAINEAEEALKKNIEAWETLIAARDKAVNNVVNSDQVTGSDKDALGDYITNTINGKVLTEKTATDEELAEYTAEIQRLEAIAVENGMVAGTDVTYMLKCPNMDNASFWNVKDPTKGWVVEGNRTDGCNWRIAPEYKCAECWNGNDYDVYQVVEGAPVGIYEISLQGFYRPGGAAASFGYYFNKDGSRKDPPEFGNWKENKSYVYMNTAQTLLDNVWNYGQTRKSGKTYDDTSWPAYVGIVDGDSTWFCNGMPDGGKAFDAGAYKVSAYGLVGEKGDVMRVGIKGNNYGLDNWAIFTRFKLTYQRFDATILKDFLDSEITSAKGRLSELYGYDKRQALTTAIKTAETAAEGTDGDAMFAALKVLTAAESNLTASIEKFDTLMTKKGALDEAINNYESIAKQEAYDDACAFSDDVLVPGLPEETPAENVTITDEQATQYIKKVDELIAALRIPSAIGSDDEPADYTSMIDNYNYASNNGNGWTLDNKEGNNNYNYNAAEYFQGVYNHYQDIKNLPAGTYMVSNQGFYRWVSATEDFDSVRNEVPSLASMYVKVFTDETEEVDSVACPLRHLSAEAVVNNSDIAGQTTAALFGKEYDDTPWYVPNSMESFSLWIKNSTEDYQNQIIVKVAEGQTLRIGVAQAKSVTNGWAIFTNWTLTAYGPESAKEEGVLTSSYANYKPTLNTERATVRKALNDAIEEANAYLETMEDGEAKEELSLAITTAKGVLNGTEKTETTEATKSTDYSNDDVVAATNALKTAYEKATGIDGVSVKADKAVANGKYFKGGKLIIVKNGKSYNAAGAVIK